MIFSPPIIYAPILDFAVSKSITPLTKKQPTKIGPFTIQIIVSQFVPSKEEKDRFDSFTQLTFREIVGTKFLIFKKNGFVEEIHVLTEKSNSISIAKYKRNIDNLQLQIPQGNASYLAQTREIIISLLQKDDFIIGFSPGEYILTFEIEAFPDVFTGEVYISSYPYYHLFCFRENYINSALRDKQTQALVFSITFWNGYIPIGNLFDEKIMNGFECYFYPHQGLRFLTELKNGKQMDVTAWDKGGDNEKKIPFDEWAKIITNTKLMKESQ